MKIDLSHSSIEVNTSATLQDYRNEVPGFFRTPHGKREIYDIEIKCDNAAFEDVPSMEVARILRELAQEIDGDEPFIECHGKVADANGHTVGSYTVTSD